MNADELTENYRSNYGPVKKPAVQKYDPDQPRAPAGSSDGGQWTSGGGGGSGDGARQEGNILVNASGIPIRVRSIEEGLRLLSDGKGIMFDRPDQAVALLDRINAIAEDAKAKGAKAPVYDLCNVHVAGTNLFCSESIHIPRSDMPQLTGIARPGTPGEDLPRNRYGEVDLREGFIKRMLESGVGVETLSVPASQLRASQNQLNGTKVAAIIGVYEREGAPKDPIVVSKENYVIDGHHRWAAQVSMEFKHGREIMIPVQRVDLTALQTLYLAQLHAMEYGVMQLPMGKLLKYSPEQPRDDHGRFSEVAARMTAEAERRIEAAARNLPHPDRQSYMDTEGSTGEFNFIKDMTAYHGTSAQAWEYIQKEGLIGGKGKGAAEWARQHFTSKSAVVQLDQVSGERKASIYLTTARDQAENFAHYAKRVTGADPVLLEIRIPRDQLKLKIDEVGSEDRPMAFLRTAERIPPEWIKRMERLERAVGDESSYVPLYVVLLVDDGAEKSFASSGSATSGLTGYSLEGQRARRSKLWARMRNGKMRISAVRREP